MVNLLQNQVPNPIGFYINPRFIQMGGSMRICKQCRWAKEKYFALQMVTNIIIFKLAFR
jgi:hypothetical protein